VGAKTFILMGLHSTRRYSQIAAIRRLNLVVAVLLLATLSPLRAWGAALELYETGAPDLGTASAGRAAMAEDASTAAANPAGMTQLGRSQLLGASGALLPTTNFDVDPRTPTTPSGGGGGNAGVFIPIGSFYYAHKLSERLWLGVSVFSDYGLSGNYGKTWVGRYYLTYESLISGKVNPAIAYEVNDWLSVGAGFSFGVARLKFQSRVNNILPKSQDGGLALESWDEAFGGNAGILLKPLSNLRVGLTYQSPEDYKFGFRPHLTGLGPLLSHVAKRIGGVKAYVPLTEPQQVMLSAVYGITPKLSLMGNVGWQNWSAFGEFPVGISAKEQRTVSANLHFSDTCQIAIGQQYQLAEKWLWSAGFAYDSSSVSKTYRSVVLPVDRQLRYGTGIEYQINQDVSAGVSAEMMDAGPAPLTASRGPLAGTVQGHYSSNYLNFVAVNLIWKF